jgi:hypothetical protein
MKKSMRFENFQGLFILLSFLTTSCGTAPEKPEKNRDENHPEQKVNSAAQSSPQKENEEANSASLGVPTLKLLEDVSLSESSEGSLHKVPSLRFQVSEQGYAQVLRCHKSYVFQGPLGEDLSELSSKELRKWAWYEAWESREQGCLVTSTKQVGEPFLDLTADSGSFYYILNPCQSREVDGIKSESCSYDLVFSKSIKFENTASKEFLNVAKQVADAESSVVGGFSRMRYFANLISERTRECEEQQAMREAGQGFLKGITTLLAMGTGAFVGGIVSGGVTGIQGAKAGLALARKLFAAPTPGVAECVPAEALKTHAAQNLLHLEESVRNVLALRVQLSSLNQSYAQIDKKILEE